MYEVTMKCRCLFFCCIFIIFWGSLSIVFATPILDRKDGGDSFTSGEAGFENGNRHFSRESAKDCFAGFPGQSGIGKYNNGSADSAFKDDKNARKSKSPNPHGNMEEDQGLSNPVPSTLFLLGAGLIGLAAFRRKRVVRS
jgi:hypothetical protein